MNTLFARLEHLMYREGSFYTGDGRVGSVEILRVYFITPYGEMDHYDLSNPATWTLDNQALQFMAKWGYRPSDFDGTRLDCHDDQVLLPVVLMGEEGFGLHEDCLENGREALQEAEWFGAESTQGVDSNGAGGPPGGGDDDPGTGNRAEVELADEDSDQGVTVEVS